MSRPELSISTVFDYGIPIQAQISLIAEASFTHISLGAKESYSACLSRESRSHLKELLDEHSLAVDTIHGPSPDRDDSIDLLAKAARAACDLSAAVVVLHGGPFNFEKDELAGRLDALLRCCEAVQPVASEAGVVFALENVMPGPATDIVRQALPKLDPRHFGFCYDSSHDQIGGPRPFDLLEELGDRLVAVHLSDRVREFVDHVPPGDGFIDWGTLCTLIRRSSFAGPVGLEVMVANSFEKDALEFLKLTHERGGQIYDKIFW